MDEHVDSNGITGEIILVGGLLNVVLVLHVLSSGGGSPSDIFISAASMFEPVLVVGLLSWWLSQRLGISLPRVFVMLSTMTFAGFMGVLSGRGCVVPVIVSGCVCFMSIKMLEWRRRVLTPSWSEARFLTLSARMRPHFLFNTLNAIASLIRLDVDKAEDAVLDLSDIFRAFLKEDQMIRLSDELATCRKYLGIEKLRLGDRLEVVWDVPSFPSDVEIPALLLQPLLENAVRHGIEPKTGKGEISVRISAISDRLVLKVSNPLPESEFSTKGNGIALKNIKERLALRYGQDAGIESKRKNGCHEARITMPLRRKSENVLSR